MARKKRIIEPEYCYHVMLRGVGGRTIFHDNHDRARFCLLLQYASETSHFAVHGFCLMDNHVHLILQPRYNNLSSGMHRLAFRYAQHFNKRTDRQGYLYQGRYKAIMVQNGSYLRRLIRYVHRNPVRGRMVKEASDYYWSSHNAYLGFCEFTWLQTELILSLFGNEFERAREELHYYVNLDDSDTKKELEEIHQAAAIGAYGSLEFVAEFQRAQGEAPRKAKFLSPSCGPWQPAQHHSDAPYMDNFVNQVANATGVTPAEMQSPSRKAELVNARAVLVRMVIESNAGTAQELALLLHRDPTSVCRLWNRANRFPELYALADKLLDSL